ncbi:MAG TPA: HlyD family type I secretion periplasmic adaptor subunit, partial [Patescibacteria group bacterium]|nr:HlyD family type I secretion periplasmic adaptor subunit [Patescibacteria group bacterium]
TATGEVVPEGKVKLIQHLEGGIVRDIYVHDGDLVKEGQALIQLDLPVSAINRDELQVRLDGLNLTRARLLAEVEGKPLVFPADEAKRQPALVEAERHSFEARKQNLAASLAVLDQQVLQRSLEVQELEAKQHSVASSLSIAREKLTMSTDLLKDGLTSKMEHVQLRSEVETLEGQLNTLHSSVPRAESALAETKRRVDEEKIKVNRAIEAELTDAELNLARNRELIAQASDQQRRAAITSPTDGIVKNMRQNTIGGVVRPGEPIMEIVPVHERLNIEAKVNPADRGYVAVGQPSLVKISAYDYTRYGGLAGKVVMVAADTTVGGGSGADAQPFYRVVIETDKSNLGPNGELPITPGMQAQVDIHTGQRSVLRYLITPVLKLRHEAFRER